MPELSDLQQRLRSFGAAIDGQRRPVDVDAILAGRVPVPPRRVVRRRTPILVLAAVAALVTGLVVIARPTDRSLDDVRVQVPGGSTVDGTVPATDPPGVHRFWSADGREVIRIEPTEAPKPPVSDCVGAAPSGCDEYKYDITHDGEWAGSGQLGMPIDEPTVALRFVGGGGGFHDPAMWYRVRADVARVEVRVHLEGGGDAVQEIVPQDGLVILFDWDEDPLAHNDPTAGRFVAYDVAGNQVGTS